MRKKLVLLLLMSLLITGCGKASHLTNSAIVKEQIKEISKNKDYWRCHQSAMEAQLPPPTPTPVPTPLEPAD